MNPALIGFIRHAITLVFGMVFAQTSLTASDVETLASGAIIVLNLAWFAYDRRSDIRRKPKDSDRC